MLKNFDFIAKRKLFLYISLALIAVGLIVNIFLGVELDIQFKGGTLLQYTYENQLDKVAATEFIHEKFKNAEINITDNGESGLPTIAISLPDEIDVKTQTTFVEELQKKFPDSKITSTKTNSLQPSYSRTFFAKCCVAILIASLFLVVYVGFRFRKIGGVSAGVVSLLALLHDILLAYFVFVIFRIPLNDNFVAVVLTILGYSLNDTIVIYDRIRENRLKMDKKTPISDIVNVSLRQTFGRTLNTSICTLVAIGTVAVAALIFSLDAITSFAIPMSVGVVCGFYSSTFLCAPMWALWVEFSEKHRKTTTKKKRK